MEKVLFIKNATAKKNNGVLKNKSFLVTGKLNGISRAEVKSLIEENLVYVKKLNKNLSFENLTMAPIEKDLINFKLLTIHEKNYLFRYHLEVYSKISKYLKQKERKWLASFIN